MGLLSNTVTAKTIVVLGDSISAGYGMNSSQAWVSLLQEKLHADNKDYTVINESISGDTSAGGLARLDAIISKHHPDILLLELGANDGLQGLSPAHLKENLGNIISKMQKTGAKVVLLGMKIPFNYGKRYIDRYYNVFPELESEYQIPFVPFILEDVALNKELMQSDGLHPNAQAQALILDKIWPYLQPLLSQ
jgi:acyl-CoA thioesterase-1